MNPCYLRGYVHLAVVRDAGILLDLRRGDYISLNPLQMSALSSLVRGWPSMSAHNCQVLGQSEQAAVDLAKTLMKRGLLTEDALSGKDATPIALEVAEARLVDPDDLPIPEVRLHHLFRLMHASASATLSLRLRRFGAVFAAAHRRRVRRMNQTGEVHLDAMRCLVHVFLHLRPFFYTSRDNCLFDSLVLLEFLASYGVFPQWVLGVKTNPFAAHSWVQQGKYVLNGGHEVRRFSPIVAA